MRSAFNDPLLGLRKETAWLLMEFKISGMQFSKDRHGQLACEMVVVRMHDAWTRFCREVVIRSALGNTVTLAGASVPRANPSIVDRNSAIVFLLSTYTRRRRYEPKWGDATECIDAARRLMIANFATVSASLGATNSPAEEIRHVRNFYTHRKIGSASRAIATNLFVGSKYPDVYQLLGYSSGGGRIIESWVQQLMLVATASVQ